MDQPVNGEPANEGNEKRYEVLEVFGLKLEVSNPRLAELLTMDAGEALQVDLREVAAAPQERPADAHADISEALPDVVVAPPTSAAEQEVRRRHEFRADAEKVGQELGFTVRPDGIWSSPTGLIMVTRTVEHALSLAAASHFVHEIAERREATAGEDATALFIVDSQQTADVFKVAIRQRRLYHLMRTISLDNLREIAEYVRLGVLDHSQAIVLLAPMENIDVGEVLSVIRTASE